MTTTLQEIMATTSQIFQSDDGWKKPTLPEPPIIWKDKIAALEEANLSSQRAACIFEMRCWQAKELGFHQVTTVDLVKMLMGEPHTDTEDAAERQNYEWAYNHHDNKLLEKIWGGKPVLFKRIIRNGLWHLPPFSKKLIWTCQFGKLNYLKREIPYGVVLRLNECKELKLFNCFNVLAPMEAWQRKTDVDPIVVATIWELPPTDGKFNTAGQSAHFFLAQW